MYKDKDRQREAVKLATRRYRQKVSRVSQDTADSVIPCRDILVIPTALPIRPEGVSNNQWNYIKWKAAKA